MNTIDYSDKNTQELMSHLYRQAFMSAIHNRLNGERVVIIETDNYCFAAFGYTCKIVDLVRAFRKNTTVKRFLWFKRQVTNVEKTPCYSLDAVNELAAYGGKLPPLSESELLEMMD